MTWIIAVNIDAVSAIKTSHTRYFTIGQRLILDKMYETALTYVMSKLNVYYIFITKYDCEASHRVYPSFH